MRYTKRLVVAALVLAACSDSSTGGDAGIPSSELNVLRLPVTAPALCADSVGGWFKKTATGGPTEIALEFPEEGSTCNEETEDFLRLRLDRSSLDQRPDGSSINIGDSVFISVKWVGSDSIMFEMKPSGLKFASGHEARLKIEYDKLNGDLNEDGNNDEDDDDIERRLDMYRQEDGDTNWYRIGTIKLEDDDEIEGELTGFSRYMLAY